MIQFRTRNYPELFSAPEFEIVLREFNKENEQFLGFKDAKEGGFLVEDSPLGFFQVPGHKEHVPAQGFFLVQALHLLPGIELLDGNSNFVLGHHSRSH